MGVCDILGFLFVSYCARQRNIERKPNEKFDIDFQWSYINFTWTSPASYHMATTNLKYVPENNAIAGIKYYDNRMYIALPRLRTGTPVTLAFIPITSKVKTNPLLRPYPSWDMNVLKNCSTLQNVQSMEIDRYGVMWVIDGIRMNGLTKCPPKIVLLDLKNGGRVLHSYIIPNDVTLHQGGFLDDIVVDESDGGFAYITDNSAQDPGLVVYSRVYNKSWKLRDSSMYAEIEAADFSVDGLINENLMSINGIALAPTPLNRKRNRMVYFCALSGYSLYAISTHILKDEEFCKGAEWRRDIEFVGKKRSQSDGIIIDNKGNLFYGLLSKYGVGKWNIRKSFGTSKNVDVNKQNIVWPNSFTFDFTGNLYLLANGINKYYSRSYQLKFSPDIKFKILKMFTGTNSYLYKGVDVVEEFVFKVGGSFQLKKIISNPYLLLLMVKILILSLSGKMIILKKDYFNYYNSWSISLTSHKGKNQLLSFSVNISPDSEV
ncbi:hypothetical protein FQA39_LY07395 [Lamprigera yunnana]|nr:hypothetical protein FQA39_LY07395 [Lamprigera yunnana]